MDSVPVTLAFTSGAAKRVIIIIINIYKKHTCIAWVKVHNSCQVNQREKVLQKLIKKSSFVRYTYLGTCAAREQYPAHRLTGQNSFRQLA